MSYDQFLTAHWTKGTLQRSIEPFGGLPFWVTCSLASPFTVEILLKNQFLHIFSKDCLDSKLRVKCIPFSL